MRRLVYAVILGALLLAPVKKLDVADLEPIQAVAVYKQDGKVILETDTGDRGMGKDAGEALKDMQEKTPTVIYLDTAEFLLIGEDSQDQVELLRPLFHGNVKLARYNGGDVGDEAKYADIHSNLPRLKNWGKNTG